MREKATLEIDECHLSTSGAGLKSYRLLWPILLVLNAMRCLPALQGQGEMLPHQSLEYPAMSEEASLQAPANIEVVMRFSISLE